MLHRFGIVLAFFLSLFLALLLSPSLGVSQPRLEKKLIEIGWDIPTPAFVRDNIRTMEERPFDGIIFRTEANNHVFDTTAWKESEIAADVAVLSTIEWGRFTDNFLMLYAANRWNMEFYNDEHWKAIANNMRLMSKLVKAGKCVGVCFDTEPYGNDPWAYPGTYGDRSFAEVQAQVRKRGADFMTALQSSVPDIKVLSFFQYAMFAPLVDEPDQAVRDRMHLNLGDPAHYALLPAFFNGMLDAAAPGVRLIDGNENSYWYEDADHFYRAYHLMKQRCQTMVPVELRTKYAFQVQAGMALYVDEIFARRINQKTTANFLAPEEQLTLFEHNTYYALTTTDEYVWLYSERMNWWKDAVPGAADYSVEGGRPEGLEAAVISARGKYEKGLPLGFDVRDMIDRARKERRINQ